MTNIEEIIIPLGALFLVTIWIKDGDGKYRNWTIIRDTP